MGITSGKLYWEVYINDSGSGYFYLGLNGGYEGGGGYSGYTNLNGMTNGVRVRDNGTVSDDTAAEDPDRWGTVSVSSTGVSTMDNTDVVMVALDYDNKKLYFGFKNECNIEVKYTELGEFNSIEVALKYIANIYNL